MYFYSSTGDQMGISRESIVDIPHRELFLRFIKIIESKIKCLSFEFAQEKVMRSMVRFCDMILLVNVTEHLQVKHCHIFRQMSRRN
jgi:hypothetical protein